MNLSGGTSAPQVMDFESGAFQHGGHQGFSRIVEVTLNGSNDHPANRFGPGTR